jgi:hypothetical protein
MAVRWLAIQQRFDHQGFGCRQAGPERDIVHCEIADAR